MWSGLTSGLSSALQSFDQVIWTPSFYRPNKNLPRPLQAARDVVQITTSEDVEEDEEEEDADDDAGTAFLTHIRLQILTNY